MINAGNIVTIAVVLCVTAFALVLFAAWIAGRG